MSQGDLASFQHRTDYEHPTGRDQWTVRTVHAWIADIVPRLLASDARAGALLDVGCGEQPFRSLVERSGWRYVGMDVVQNAASTVDILGTLEKAPDPPEVFRVVLCTEVLEHVTNIDAAFAGLRRLVSTGGSVIVTVPFVFPLHMEPYDFRRLTLYGIEHLAAAHRFRCYGGVRLGRSTDVLATLVADLSILPAARSFHSRVKARLLRTAQSVLVRLLDAPGLWRHVNINSNTYLTNGVILRAE